MANPSAGIYVVIAKAGTNHFLHQIDFFVGASGRRNSTYAGTAILALNIFKTFSGISHRLFPGHFFPWVVDTVANHGYCNTVFMSGVTKGKAALNTGVAFVGLAVFVRCHAHYLVALHFCFK